MSPKTSFAIIACLFAITLSNSTSLFTSVPTMNTNGNSFQNPSTNQASVSTGNYIPVSSSSQNPGMYQGSLTVPLSATVPPVSGNLIPITGSLPLINQIPHSVVNGGQNYNPPSVGSPIIPSIGSPAVTTLIPISTQTFPTPVNNQIII